MGKTARWFLGLLGWTKGESPPPSAAAVSDAKPVKEKKRWSFVKSLRDKDRTPAPPVNGDEKNGSYREGSSSHADGVDQNKHAIAVAAATAAVAQAAVAAAQAAAAVVRITSSERCDKSYVSGNVGRREDWAALKIQAMFRGYLARRALRALKGLVKLQALVRGRIVRKEMQAKLLGLQALVRVQSKARAGRTHNSESQLPIGKQSLLPHHLGLATPDKYERPFRTNSAKHDWLSNLKRKGLKPNSWDAINLDKMHSGSNWFEAPTMRNGITDDEKSDKILEIDNGKPNFNSKRRQALASDRNSHSCTTFDSPSRDYTTAQLSVSSPSSCEVQSLGPLKFSQQVVETAFGIADDSSQFFSASSRPGSVKRGSFTPLESEEGSQSFLGGYFDHPNYMANTKSSMAKARSQSTPKQRPDYERSISVKRFPVHGFGDMRSSARRTTALHANFVRKAYPGSGRLDRLGMPIHSDTCDRNRY